MTKFFVKISQYKFFLLINIPDLKIRSKNCSPPGPENNHLPIFPSNLPLKMEFLPSPHPLFENFVAGSTPFPAEKVGVHTMRDSTSDCETQLNLD